MADNADPTAQGQVAATETPNETVVQVPQGQPQAAPQPHDGFQRRIDELIASIYDLRRDNESKDRQVAELLGMIAESRQPAPPQIPPVDFAPEDLQRLNVYKSVHVDPVLSELKKMQAQMANQLQQMEFQRLANGEDPRVVKRAQELLAGWKRGGYTGWTEKDALVYARGEIGATDTRVQQQAQQQRAAFNNAAPNGALPAAPPPPVSAAPATAPADLEQLLTDDRALEELERRLKNTRI